MTAETPTAVVVPEEWLLAAAIEAHNDGRDQLGDFDGDDLEFLSDGIAAVIHLIRADERARCVAELDGYAKTRMWSAADEVAAGRDSGFDGVRFASTLSKAARLLATGELSVPPIELADIAAREAAERSGTTRNDPEQPGTPSDVSGSSRTGADT